LCGELLAGDLCPLGEHCDDCCTCGVCPVCGDLLDGPWMRCADCDSPDDFDPRPIEDVTVTGGVL
jgi:hypothetical protein